jgi:hypothetical protein
MDKTTRQELVEHLVLCMEQQGLTIEAADAPGHRKPPHVKSGLRRSRVRPDVVARDGRRTIFGIVHGGDQLEVLAGKCRTLVICVPKAVADEAASTLLHNVDTQLSRKMRLLKHPDTSWQEMPRRAHAARLPAFDPVVRIVADSH